MGWFQSFGHGGANWRANRAENFWHPSVNFWNPPAGGCQFLQGGANHAFVVDVDIKWTNGVIHVVDSAF